jgi:hypothetical protein
MRLIRAIRVEVTRREDRRDTGTQIDAPVEPAFTPVTPGAVRCRNQREQVKTDAVFSDL